MRLVFASLLSPSAFGAFLFGKRVSSFGLPVAAGRLGRNTRPALSVQMSTESAAPGSLPSKTLVVANPSAADLNYTTWKAQAKALVESIYDGISAPFSCSGTLTVQHPVQVTTLKDEVTYTIQPPPAVPEGEGQPSEADAAKEMVERQVDLLKAFVEQAPPAVFGKGSEELYDEKVRHGRQLAADAFSTNIDAEALRGVLRQVQKDLGLRVGIEAEPYSVNIYEEGGLFESHKDTPRGRGMFGTLVMCLPSLFVGGALQVGMTHATVQSYFGLHFDQCKDPFKESLSGDPSWWSPDRAASGGYKIPWCAFFSDADHCVRPVRKGVRVSLSYLLRRSDDGDSDAGLAPRRAIEKDDDQASELMKAFRLIKFNPFKCQVSVGFPCDHLYTTSDVFPDRGRPRDPDDIRREGHMYESGSIKSMNKLTADAIGKLKGRDLLVASAAHSVGLQVFLMPFLTSRDGDHYITSFDAWYLDEVDGEQYQVLDQVFDPPPDCSRPGDVADVWIKGHLDGGRRHEAQVG